MPERIKLFYANGACSLAPHIALEEAQASYEPILVDTKGGEHRRPEYLRINPKTRVPALAVGDWVLTENPAILQFIARSFPDAHMWPEALRDQARVSEWLAWIASTVHVAYAHVRRAERYATTDAALAEVRTKGVASSLELWRAVDALIGEGPWAIGNQFTVADAYLLVFWTWGRGPTLAFDMERECPNWTAHAKRMGKRRGVQRAFEREGLDLPF